MIWLRQKKQDNEAARHTPRLRLLVIDENEAARAAIATRLTHMGHLPVLAESGFAALGLLPGQRFDCILIDLGISALSGPETIRRLAISGLLAGSPIIAIAGSADREALADAIRLGVDGHIAKPFDFDMLEAQVLRCVERSRRIADLERHNDALDARIARRAVELGEARAQLEEMREDRARLVASLQSLHDEVERLSARG